MVRRIAEARQGREVFRGCVSLVTRIAVSGIEFVQGRHHPVPMHLGDNRGRRDGGAQAIAVDDALLGHHEAGHLEGVDQHDIRVGDELHNGAPHRLERCPLNGHPVDIGGTDLSDRPRHGPVTDRLAEALALGRGHDLGVGEPGDVPIGVEHDGGGHHGASETSAANFVHARDVDEAQPPQGVLKSPRGLGPPHVARARGCGAYAGRRDSRIRAALPFSFRR